MPQLAGAPLTAEAGRWQMNDEGRIKVLSLPSAVTWMYEECLGDYGGANDLNSEARPDVVKGSISHALGFRDMASPIHQNVDSTNVSDLSEETLSTPSASDI